MGMYTLFDIEAKNIDSNSKTTRGDLLVDIYSYTDEVGFYEIHNALYGEYEGKWYHYANDMLELSKKFPGVLFTVNGIGERKDDIEDLDIWKHYFYNGKHQLVRAEIIFPSCEITD